LPPLATASLEGDIRYDELAAELGSALPTGAGVLVAQVEAPSDLVDHDDDPDSAAIPVYWPDGAHPELAGITIVDLSGARALLADARLYPASGHATMVARRFFGSAAIAPGIDTVDVQLAQDWFGAGGLEPPLPAPARPVVRPWRVSNHSWIGDTEAEEATAVAGRLRRLDWIAEVDEHVVVAGLRNSPVANAELLSHAFNLLRVGRSDGRSGRGTGALDAVYGAGRAGIDLVAPLPNSSEAAPVVAAAAALLVETGRARPGLSTDPQERSTRSRAGVSIYNAERGEVVRAALMAGAARRTANDGTADLENYRVDESNRTDNGLDVRYGAGQLDVFTSHRILVAGEQQSLEDGGASVGPRGFDWDPAFGGANGSNPVATYALPVLDRPAMLSVSLLWNLWIDAGPSDETVSGTAVLHDLDLALWDVTGDAALLQTSASRQETSEHLWRPLRAGRAYQLRVVVAPDAPAFEWDYALAWHIEPGPMSSRPLPVGALPLAVLGGLIVTAVLLLRRRGRAGAHPDH
jgi:hypothetical protein